MNNCVFCKIVRKQLPAEIIFENKYVSVFLSLENHPLVMPKKHLENILGLTAKLGGELMEEIVKASKATVKAYKADGIYITQANHKSAGQDGMHVHFHIYPKWTKKKRVSKIDRAALAKKIRKSY